MITTKRLFTGLMIILLLAGACSRKPRTLSSQLQLLDIPVENTKRLDYYKKKIEDNLPLKNVLWDAMVNAEIKQMYLRGQMLYVETNTPRLYAMETAAGLRQWQFSLKAPIDFTIGLVQDLPEQELAIRNNITKLTKELDMEIKTKGRDETKIQDLRRRLDSAKESYRNLKLRDVLYLTSGGTIYCLNRGTGELLNQKPLEFVPATAPTATTSFIFIGALDHQWVYQLDVNDYYGKNWFKAKSIIRSRPIYEHPLLYFATDDGNIYAYDIETESLRWTYTAEKSIKSDIVMDGDMLFVGSEDYALYAINRYSGTLLWKVETGAPIITRPIIDKKDKEKTLYFRSEGNALFAVELGVVATKDTFGNDITLPCCKVKWKFPEGKQFLVRGRQYCYIIGADNRTLYAVDPATGEVKNKYSLDLFPVRVGDREAGVVYLGTADGLIYAVKEP